MSLLHLFDMPCTLHLFRAPFTTMETSFNFLRLDCIEPVVFDCSISTVYPSERSLQTPARMNSAPMDPSNTLSSISNTHSNLPLFSQADTTRPRVTPACSSFTGIPTPEELAAPTCSIILEISPPLRYTPR